MFAIHTARSLVTNADPYKARMAPPREVVGSGYTTSTPALAVSSKELMPWGLHERV